MAKTRPFKTLAEQIADLDDPAPRDIDPEEFGGQIDHGPGSDSSGEDDEQENAREHYEDVGKSKLREPQQPLLGPRYSGSRISRENLRDEESSDGPFGSGASQREEVSQDEDEVVDPDEVDVDMATGEGAEDEDIDSEEAFGEGDEEAFKGFAFRGSGIPREAASRAGKRGGIKSHARRDEDEEMSSEPELRDEENTSPQDGSVDGEDDSELDEEAMSVDGSVSHDDNLSDASSTDNFSPSTTPLPASRAALRQMMAESQSTVLATISLAAKADAAKGRAVQHQRSTFDTLLNTRIRLQQALIATNSLATTPLPAEEKDTASIHAAETAALALFSSLSTLLHSLHPSLAPLPPTTRTTPTPTLATTAHALTSASRPHHRATLAKWAARTHLPSALPPRSRLAPQPTTQPLLSLLDAHLSPPSLPRLLARTRLPRSCAPLQAATATATATATGPAPPTTSPATIFDDADFYALLLRELVERKMGARGGGVAAVQRNGDMDPSALTRAAKVRRKVDTKASKGRKMRYAVHERLQNFMAREEGRGWGEGRAGELFGGLLGRRVVGGLGEGEGEEGEEDGLRLFGGGGGG
ncbi:rRNA-processing protein bfr2 [Xylographa pallens]|nr:rRNA-processing protein bfr2 [Xylographa pallens]